MKTITKSRRVLLISSLDHEAGQADMNQALKLSDAVHRATRNLYRYDIVRHYGTSVELTSDELMQEFNIAREILNYDYDEVWVFGCSRAENSMGGSNAFWLGAEPVHSMENIYRRFPFMRFGPNETPLMTYARRVENTMYRVYAGYPREKNMWEMFIRTDRTHPGFASCGTVTYPPNGIMQGYRLNVPFMSDADEWEKDYPNFRGRVRLMDSQEWGRTQEGYLMWWLMHLPHGEHKLDGIHENWWHYIMNLDLIK